jgi:tRNA modification GTPase
LSGDSPIVRLSALKESGIEKLEEEIVGMITQGIEVPGEVAITSVRQKNCLEKVNGHLRDAGKGCRQGAAPELVAIDIRLALDELGQLTGEVVTDELLDSIFSRFCIGK